MLTKYCEIESATFCVCVLAASLSFERVVGDVKSDRYKSVANTKRTFQSKVISQYVISLEHAMRINRIIDTNETNKWKIKKNKTKIENGFPIKNVNVTTAERLKLQIACYR